MIKLSFFSPLEQFEILPLLFIRLGILDFSITNQVILLLLIFFFTFVLIFSCFKSYNAGLFIVPHRYQIILEFMYSAVLGILLDNVVGKKSQKFFPLIFSLFFFILSMNVIGLIPYSFTVTSHFIVIFALSLSVFIGINIICVKIHKLGFFSLFLPSGTPLALSFLLVPIELILYLFRPLSSAIRLFCNMMAGHILLKILVGFAWSLTSFTGLLFLVQYIPLFILLPFLGLELGVSIVQAFVFSLLTCIYLNDAINLH